MAAQYAGAIMQGAGALMHIGGTFLAANAAEKVQRKLDEIVNMPGVDVNAAYGTAIDAFNQNEAGAQGIASRTNAFNQQQMNEIVEGGIPGFSGLQAQRIKTASDWMNGDIPQSVSDAVRRTAVAQAWEGGYGGSPSGRNLVARDLGRTVSDYQEKGQALTSEILRSTPLAKLVGPQDILNMSGKDIVNLLSSERTQKMSAMRDRAIAPGKTAVWAENLHWGGESLINQGASMSGSSAGAGAAAGGGGF